MKTITSVELAKLAGVSQSTVSRCLNDSPLVSDETKARVKKIAEEYSFQFNTNARGLKTNRTGVVGYIFSEDFSGFANHYIQSDLYYRIRMQLLEHGIDVVVSVGRSISCADFNRHRRAPDGVAGNANGRRGGRVHALGDILQVSI